MNGSMRAMRIHRLAPLQSGTDPLEEDRIPIPQPHPGEVLIRVAACGVCRTDLDEIEGRAPPPQLPVTPGHQVVGEVVAEGDRCRRQLCGKRVGVAWIYSACGDCGECRAGLENLCVDFLGTGRDRPGGYSEYLTVPEAFALLLPDGHTAAEAAPLLCAGAVGYRALNLTRLRDGEVLALTGFGSSGQLVLQMARHLYPASPVYVFARSAVERNIALELGASWAGDTDDRPPQPAAGAIDTTPAWRPVLSVLEALKPGGRLVINAIRKEAGDSALLAQLDYERHLWHEKSIQSVANVTRRDIGAVLELAAAIKLRPRVREYRLRDAGRALFGIKRGDIEGSAVLIP